MSVETTWEAPDELLGAERAAKPIHQVYNDRGHTVGWKCSACGRFSGFKSAFVHLEDCVHAVWRTRLTPPAPDSPGKCGTPDDCVQCAEDASEYAKPYKQQIYAAAYAPEAVDKIREALEAMREAIINHMISEQETGRSILRQQGFPVGAPVTEADVAKIFERSELHVTYSEALRLLPTLTAPQPLAEPEWEDRPDEYSEAIKSAYLAPHDHALYGKAFEMVSNRHSKFALVHLVYWLLTRPTSLTVEQRETMVEEMRVEIQSRPIYLKATKQLRQMLKDRHRPVSVYHNDESAREVAEATLAVAENVLGKGKP